MKNSFAFYQGASPGVSNFGARLAAAAGRRGQDEFAGMKDAAHMDLYEAQADEARAKANAAGARNTLLGDDTAGLSALGGIAEPLARKAAEYFRTGKLVYQPLTPNDDEGNPLQPAETVGVPTELAPHMPRLDRARQTLWAARAGGGNADQLSRAAGNFQEQGITDQVQADIARAGITNPVDLASARNQGGKLGTAIKRFDNGAGGSTFNIATGESVAGPANNKAVAELKALMVAAGIDPESPAAQEMFKQAVTKQVAPANGARLQHTTDAQGRAWNFNPSTGEYTPAIDPSTGAQLQGKNTAPEKALPHGAVKDLAAAGEAVEGTSRLARTFKPEYGGHFILGDMLNTYKRIAGDETGMAQWWQDMDNLQNQTRHALFGSALTATELAAWEKTSITPRMSPAEIQVNLARRAEIESRAASKLARSYAAGGYNQEQIKELLGVGAQYLDRPAPPASQQPGRTVVPSPGMGASPAGPVAPKAPAPAAVPNNRPPPKVPDGTRGTSASGRPIIMQNGQWVYAEGAA